MSLRDNFWSKEDEFLVAVEMYCNKGTSAMSALVGVLEERAEIEDSYRKRLKKLRGGGMLGSTILGVAETDPAGSVVGMLGKVREEIVGRETVHKKIATECAKAAAALKECVKNQKLERKTLLMNALGFNKERSSVNGQFQKQRKKYVETVVKKEQLEGNLAQLKEQLEGGECKNVKSLNEEMAKTQKSLKTVCTDEMRIDQEVKELAARSHEIYPEWVGQMYRFFDTVEQREKERIEEIKAQMTALTESIAAFHSELDGCLAVQMESAKSVDAVCDVAAYCEANRLLTSPVLPPEYVPRVKREKLVDITTEPLDKSVFDMNYAVVTDEFIGEECDELDLFVGEKFEVLLMPEDTDGWWVGRNYDRIGWFPSTFVTLTKEP